MEITIIHGQGHQGSTYHITTMIKDLLAGSDTMVHEYFMPEDAPAFCAGCYQCILKGEEYCPQADKVQRIVKSMLCSDIVVIDSPTYCLEMTGQLKTLFDHFGYMWLSHRPRREMFAKTGIAISTAAGAGARGVTGTIAGQMFWWGIPRNVRFIIRRTYLPVIRYRFFKIGKNFVKLYCSHLAASPKGEIGKKRHDFENVFFYQLIRAFKPFGKFFAQSVIKSIDLFQLIFSVLLISGA